VNPIFSIIIPIYNSEETILNSFNSIKDQKIFKKTEIILIDDASTDTSKKICKNLEKENNNIRTIFNKTNLGVSRSRNKGIKIAKGDYLIFLDSDDSLCPKILDKIKVKIKVKKYDVLYLNKNLKKNYYLNNSDLASQNINKLDYFTCHCWNFIIKREFLIKNNIYFKNIKIFEDQVFVTELMMLGKNFYFFKKKILNHFAK
jgi:glycosyltransferase involved in cell wall biosynthesis